MKSALTGLLLCITLVRSAAQVTHANSPDPGPRRNHILLYDNHARRVLLVDASPRNDSVARTQEIWSWDGNRWLLLTSGAPPLPARTTSAVAYDASRGSVLLYGGRTGAMTQHDVTGDTWTWNGDGWKAGRDSTIGSRDHASMAFDSRRGRAVLFGGTVFPRVDGEWNRETWEWDGAHWKKASSDGPAGRITAMTYDSRRNEVVLFGGHGPGQPAQYFGDTWLWNGSRWRAGPAGPEARSAHAIAFDEKSGLVLLYGGGTRTNGVFRELGDLWAWDGTRWREIPVTGDSPGARVGHAMTYDAARGVTVLHGGSRGRATLADLWEWDGLNWTRRH